MSSCRTQTAKKTRNVKGFMAVKPVITVKGTTFTICAKTRVVDGQ
ncbi:MAG: hypothetical protein U5N86_01500 [Planctomycetota bacterium]|nr:hypothetical protein [Planctomycetota bacterium]